MTDPVVGSTTEEGQVPSDPSAPDLHQEATSERVGVRRINKWVVALITVIVAAAFGSVGFAVGWLDPLADYVSPKLVKVSGRVLYNGKPLTSGFVQTYYAQRGRMGGLGPLDAEGRFQLTTNGDPGAYSGRHRVVVLYMSSGFPPKSLLPERYGQPQTSGLIIDVLRSGMGEVQLELSDSESP